jgi:hypothetical protein
MEREGGGHGSLSDSERHTSGWSGERGSRKAHGPPCNPMGLEDIRRPSLNFSLPLSQPSCQVFSYKLLRVTVTPSVPNYSSL